MLSVNDKGGLLNGQNLFSVTKVICQPSLNKIKKIFQIIDMG